MCGGVWKGWKLLRKVEGKGCGDEVVSLGRRKEGRLACRGGREWVSVTYKWFDAWIGMQS